MNKVDIEKICKDIRKTISTDYNRAELEDLIDKLIKNKENAVANLDYELAAAYRDEADKLKLLLRKQILKDKNANY